MTPLVLVALAVIYVVLSYVVLTAPRWWGGSFCRHQLWKLRDEFVDDILDGRLPRGHPAVRHMKSRLEANVRRRRPVGLVDVFLMEWLVLRRLSAEEKRRLFVEPPSTEGLTAEQRARLRSYRAKCATLFTASVLTSSWAGAAVVLWTLIRHRPETAKDAVVEATKTPLGKRTAEAAKVASTVASSRVKRSNLVHA